MRVSLESTDRIVEVDGVPARVWQGTTDEGVEVTALVTRLAVRFDDQRGRFESELRRVPDVPPNADSVAAWPNRLVL